MEGIEQTIGIQDIPDEALVEVFGYLSPKLLKIAALVCSRWNEVIGQTPELMKNFKLNLIPGRAKLTEALGLNRRFQSLRSNVINKEVQDMLTMHNLRCLELTGFVVVKEVLAASLAGLKILESLSFEHILFSDESKNKKVAPATLNKLKYLRLNTSESQILELIATTSLERFIMHTGLMVRSNLDLLNTQSSLKQLELFGGAAPSYCSEQLSQTPFKLRSFAIGKASLQPMEFSRLKELLTVHKETLTDLTIQIPLSGEFQVFIYTNFKQLKVLKAPITKTLKYLQVTSGDSSTDRFPCMRSFTLESADAKFCFIRSLKSLEAFDMTSFASQEHSQAWSASGGLCHLRDLKELHLSEIFMLFPINFPNLRELHVHRIIPEVYVEKFLRDHCETIEKLVIGWIDGNVFSRGTLIDTIKRCHKLKFISFTSDSPLAIRSFSKITRTHPWTLEANFRSLKNNETVEVRVVFRFPDDLAAWNHQCRYWDDNLVRDLESFSNYGLNAYVNQFK